VLDTLASAAFCFVARWQGLPFNLWLWLSVDALVIGAIACPLIPALRARDWARLLTYRAEMVILALFVPSVAAYTMPDPPAHLVSTAAGTVQLLVTVPLAALRRRIKRTRGQNPDQWTEFDLLVRA
jgi:hypothetical protein